MYKPGDIVQSHYNAKWYGIVASIEKRNKHEGDLINVYMMYDNCGHKQRKPKIKKLHENWLTLRYRPSPQVNVWVESLEHIKEFLKSLG